MDKRKAILLVASGIAVLSVGCKLLQPVKSRNDTVKDFDIHRYLGKWYEIARFDFTFEKNLSQVSAQYELNEDGSIKVINSGYSLNKNKWKQSIGKAKFVENNTTGGLKVSFFGPFYSAYNVVKIDSNYQYALVFGKNTKYMWILSREKSIPETIRKEYLAYAKQHGFDTSQLIWTNQDSQ